MRVTTLAPERLADQAVAARGGADLYRFALEDRIPDASFAKNSDGSFTITGVDLLKSGTFNGFAILDEDLEAMAVRFRTLFDSGVFVPPFRLDHSWSVLSVIGWFENVETYRRVDATDSMEKTFLRGDIRLTGSVEFKPADLVDAIKRGALRNRSSELGYYVTNSGVELPLVFYGCAYVDIPAVEGLSPVELSKRPSPHSITNLSADTEGSDVDPENETPETPETPEAEVDETPVDEPEETPDEEAPEEGDEDETPGEPEDEPVEDEAQVEETPASPEATELAAARAEIARLRTAAADREIAALRSAGVIVAANEEDATFLLRHDDEDVRRRAGALLGGMSATVTLGKRRGRTTLSKDGNGNGEVGSLIRLGMPSDEVGSLWASLSREERQQHRAELDAWQNDRDENGVRD